MTKVLVPLDASQQHRKYRLLDLYRTVSVFTFPLIVTPEKLVVSSSGHLDVQIKNPTSRPFHVKCSIKSFAFVLENAQNNQYNDGSQEIEHKLEPDGVLNLKIKYEDDFNGNKRTWEYDNAEGHLSIEGTASSFSVNPDGKINKEKPTIDLETEKVFSLSGVPEKMKSIMEKYVEPSERYEVEMGKEQRNENVIAKYGSKIDQMTDQQIMDAKKEEVRKMKEERMKKEGKTVEMKSPIVQTASKNKKKKKKCVVM
uniref:Major sperm protein n=1 Tax=Caenorhabditis tropicalis TaxID=1561998 RepID=A0A1I7UPJ4_9PELO